MSIANSFRNIGSVAATAGGVYFVPGNYELTLKKAVLGLSQRGKGEYAALEFDIVRSTSPDRPAGTQVSNAIYLSQGQIALANLKQFAMALTGLAEQYIDERMMEAIFGGDGTNFAGRKIAAQVALTKTKAGQDFTKIVYSAAEPPITSLPAQRPVPQGALPPQQPAGYVAPPMPTAPQQPSYPQQPPAWGQPVAPQQPPAQQPPAQQPPAQQAPAWGPPVTPAAVRPWGG